MTSLTNLSLCMIVKNEAVNLPNCLNSVKNVVAEIVIVDTGSTDNTKQIALNNGAKLYDYHWEDNFALARNYALQFVTKEWVLVLDADEILNSSIIPYMESAIALKENLVINLIRHEIGALSSPYSSLSRLFRHHEEIKFERPYHAMIDDSVIKLRQKEKHWKIVDLPQVAISHYGYQPHIINKEGKREKARKMMENYLTKNPYDGYVCNKLGALYLDIGERKKGLKLLKTGLKSNTTSVHVLYELHYHLGNAYVKEKEINQAIKHYQSAMTQPILGKLKLGSYHNYGSLCYEQGNYQEALQSYQKCILFEPKFALAYYNLGLTYRAMGQIQKAIEAYETAITLNPLYPWAYQNLGVLLYQQGYLQESLVMFQQAYNLHLKDNPTVAEKLKQELQKLNINY